MCSCYTKRKMCWKWQTGIFTCCDLTAKEPSVKRRKLLFFIKTTFGGNHVWVRWCGRKCPENDIGRFDSHHKTFADSLDVFGSYLLEILLSSVLCSNEKQVQKWHTWAHGLIAGTIEERRSIFSLLHAEDMHRISIRKLAACAVHKQYSSTA